MGLLKARAESAEARQRLEAKVAAMAAGRHEYDDVAGGLDGSAGGSAGGAAYHVKTPAISHEVLLHATFR